MLRFSKQRLRALLGSGLYLDLPPQCRSVRLRRVVRVHVSDGLTCHDGCRRHARTLIEAVEPEAGG
jgi:hypothetical protein